MNIFIAKELGCAYRWNDEFQELEWCPMHNDGLLNEDEWGCIDEDIVGDEVVTFKDMEVTLSQVYRYVEKQLKVRRIK
jgi:hypothetical protein